MKVNPALAPVSGQNGLSTLHLSVAGGLTQFGAYIDTLAPGAWSSHRHWHEAEDEFILVLDGTVTLRDNNGLQDLVPGDAVCWPHGLANGHHLTNRGTAPCRYLIIGTRVAGDICHYPDEGHRQINGTTRWQVVDRDGTPLRQGDLPPELLNLPPLWGTPPAAPPKPQVLPAAARIWATEDAYSHLILGGGLGPYRHAVLGDAGGLSQFGVHLEELPPGSHSSFRHWHEAEDEMILLLSGTVVLVEKTETPLTPGDTACWPAGQPTGHQLQNRSDAPALYLTIGTRHVRDVIHYPDHDLITHKDGKARRYLHRDGTPYPQGGPK